MSPGEVGHCQRRPSRKLVLTIREVRPSTSPPETGDDHERYMTGMKLRTPVLAAVCVVAAVSACGTAQRSPGASTNSATSPSATPSPAGRLLAFLVPGAGQSATVEWVTLTGDVKATAAFTTPKLSSWTNAGALLQPYAHLVDGSIFYVDAQGAIKTLAADGSANLATNLLLRPGQSIVSFAVAPDGQQVAASVLNYPPQHKPPPNNLADPFLEPGHWWYDYETASVGQPAQRVVSRDLGTFPNLGEPAGITTVVGWDQGGPLAILDTTLATQSSVFSELTPGKALVHLGRDGSHHDQIGGTGCIPLDSNAAGNVVCYTSTSPTTPQGCVTRYAVNSPAGSTLWSASWSDCRAYNPQLSPASDRFCTDSGAVYDQGGPPTQPPQSDRTQPETCKGWLDDSTVVLWGATASGSPQVYTFDLSSGTRVNVMTAFGTVDYLGSAGGTP